MDALEKFVEEASAPIVTLFNRDPSNHPFVFKFFNSPNAKVREKYSVIQLQKMPEKQKRRECLMQ